MGGMIMKTEQKQSLIYMLFGFLAGLIVIKFIDKMIYAPVRDENKWADAWERSSSPVYLGQTAKTVDPASGKPMECEPKND